MLEGNANGEQKRDADDERDKVQDIEFDAGLMLDFRNQFGGRDVDEVAGGEGEQKGHVNGMRCRVGDQAAKQEGERG
jgi:hypothetical protein